MAVLRKCGIKAEQMAEKGCPAGKCAERKFLSL
jgi:hypothetical protein